MSKQISLTLPDDVIRRAEVLAGYSGRPVAEILTDAIEVSLDPIDLPPGDLNASMEWSDEEVLTAADSMMPADKDRRLSELLEHQQADTLTLEESDELTILVQVYQAGLLRKAKGIAEAVHRGLRKSLPREQTH